MTNTNGVPLTTAYLVPFTNEKPKVRDEQKAYWHHTYGCGCDRYDFPGTCLITQFSKLLIHLLFCRP